MFCAALMIVFVDPILFPDSASYLSFNPARSFGYPWVVNVFKFLFGGYYLNLLIGFQVFCILSVSYWLAQEIRKITGADQSLQWIIFLLALYPWGFSASLKWGVAVLTEPLTFCLAIPIFILFLRLIKHYSHDTCACLLCFFGLSLAFRSQMIFIEGPILLLSFYLMKFSRFREGAILLFSSFMVIVTVLLINTLNILWHGEKPEQVFALSHSLISAVYIMDSETLDKVESEQTKEILKPIYKKLSGRCLNLESFDNDDCGPIDKTHFLFSFDKIYYEVMQPSIAQYVKDHQEFKGESIYKLLFTSLLTQEVVYQPIRFFGHYLKTMITFGLYGKYGLLGFLVLCCVTVIRWFYTRDRQSEWLAVCLLFHMSNVVFVVLFEPHHFRYIFYTEVPIVVTLLTFTLQGLYCMRSNKISTKALGLKKGAII